MRKPVFDEYEEIWIRKKQNMDLDKIKKWVLDQVDSIAKGLGVEMRVLVLIAFILGYLIGNWT